MRRFVVACTLVFLSFLTSGLLAPLIPGAHAQTYSSPTITVTPSTVSTGSTAQVKGYGFSPNNWVFVYWQRPDNTTNGVYAFTDATGYFTFTLGFNAAHGTGNEYIAGFDYGTNRWSPFFTITVTSTTPPPATEHLVSSPNPVVVGSATMLSGSGFSRNNYVLVQWQRPDGTTNSVFVFTDANGNFSFQLGFLRSHGCGTETVQAYDYGTNTSSPPYAISVAGC